MYSEELSATAHVDMSTLVTASQVNTIWRRFGGNSQHCQGLDQCGSFTFSDLLKIIFGFSDWQRKFAFSDFLIFHFLKCEFSIAKLAHGRENRWCSLTRFNCTVLYVSLVGWYKGSTYRFCLLATWIMFIMDTVVRESSVIRICSNHGLLRTKTQTKQKLNPKPWSTDDNMNNCLYTLWKKICLQYF